MIIRRFICVWAVLLACMLVQDASIAQVTDRDKQVVARNERLVDDLKDAKLLENSYLIALARGECKFSREALLKTADRHAGLVNSALAPNSYIKEFVTSEGKAQANDLKNLIQRLEVLRKNVELIAKCFEAPPADAGDVPTENVFDANGTPNAPETPQATARLTATKKKPDAEGQKKNCAFTREQRNVLLSPLVAAVLGSKRYLEDFPKRQVACAGDPSCIHSVLNDKRMGELTTHWRHLLATFDAICATRADMTAYGPEIQKMIDYALDRRPKTAEAGPRTVSPPAKDGAKLPGSLADPETNGTLKEKPGTTGKTPPAVPDPAKKLVVPTGPAAPEKSEGGSGTTGKPVAPVDGKKKKTASKKEKPKKKDGAAGSPPPAPAQPAAPEAGGPPKDIEKDPKGGIAVEGGTLHRGTGAYGTRRTIVAWVTEPNKKICEEHKFYQFMTADFLAKWDEADERDANADARNLIKAGHPGIVTRTGSFVVPGEWSADDYREDRKDNPRTNARMTSPSGKEVEAGPYKRRAIPGVKGVMGFEDAPGWEAIAATGSFFKKVAPKDIAKSPRGLKQAAKPEHVKIGNFKILMRFRTELHCHKPPKCLGYFTWGNDESVDYFWDWAEPDKDGKLPELGMDGKLVGGVKKNAAELKQEEIDRIKLWLPFLDAKSTIDGPKAISAWKNDCTK